ncbi:MAG: TonB-dependent receptor plug domain-containing protein [Saprospiraceae bacterium]|nr:TonB-dependent receptor plug domain-containing protein [Saprospiraceae bacterium]
MQAQNDSIRHLPSAEITAQRFNRFSIGQTQWQSDSQTLSFYTSRQLNDFLQSETPLSIRTYGSGLASVATRGMAANHTAVLWNGINIQNPLNGLNDMALLDMGAVQRIDVKLGGNSALFGSGAIGGVIYLDNEKPKTQGFQAQMAYAQGSFGFQSWDGLVNYSQNKISGSVRWAQQAAENDFLFRNTADIGQPLQRAQNAAYKMQNITANIFAELTPNDFLKINYWRSSNNREVTPTMTARNDNAMYQDSANRLVNEWTHFFKKTYFKLRGAFVFDKNHYESDVIKNSRNNCQSWIGEMELNHDFSEKHRFRAGLNATKDVSNNSNYLQNHERTRFAVFINDSWATNWAVFTANVRQEYAAQQWQPTTFALGFEKKLFEFFTSKTTNSEMPKKAENSTVSPLILRGSLSRNVNLPSFNDLYWAEIGNPQLETEKGWSKELGLSLKMGKASQKWQTHLTFFDIDMKNRIVWQPQNNGVWRPTNVNRFLSRGLEVLTSVKGTNRLFDYKINANYQFVHATDGLGNVQLFVPAHKGSVSGWIQYKKIYASWQQTASSRRFGAIDKSNWTNGFSLADFSVGATPSVWSFKTDIRLAVTNVFNTDYQVIRFYPNPRREYRISLRFLWR